MYACDKKVYDYVILMLCCGSIALVFAWQQQRIWHYPDPSHLLSQDDAEDED